MHFYVSTTLKDIMTSKWWAKVRQGGPERFNSIDCVWFPTSVLGDHSRSMKLCAVQSVQRDFLLTFHCNVFHLAVTIMFNAKTATKCYCVCT